MHLFLAAFVVCLGLASIQPNNQIAHNSINDWSKTQQNVLNNFFNSIRKNDIRKSETYHYILQNKTAKDQQAFDSMKEQLWSAQLRNVNKQKIFPSESRMNASDNGAVLKREAEESTEAPDGFEDLTIGMLHLEHIRKHKKIYVDKTRYIVKMLANEGTFQLLIRPRRFGKTLFLNTIRDVLLGHQYLFKNTYIENRHDWSIKYNVIIIEFIPGESMNSLCDQFVQIAYFYEIKLPSYSLIDQTDPSYFSIIVTRMYLEKKIRNIALLVDEYDLPLLTAGSDLLKYYTQFLRSLKELLAIGYLKYVIMTGCTSINNLQVYNADNTSKISLTRELAVEDISMENEYNAVCGYTESEVRKYYGHHLDEIQRRHQRMEMDVYNEIQRWYDGYMFSGSTTEPAVYNPMSIMRYLKMKEFEGQNFWLVKNDHPRLAVKKLLELAIAEGRDLLNLERMFTYDQLYEETPSSQLSKEAANSYLQKGSLESLLFQAGYLTIASYDLSKEKYTLKIPNIEVQREFHKIIVEAMKSSPECLNIGKQIAKNFNNLDFQNLVKVFNNFVRERYRMRIWYTARDKERICQLMFGAGLMLSNEFEILHEEETIKWDNKKIGSIDIYLELNQKYKAIIEYKYDNTNMKDCMEQVENYNLPSTKIYPALPIVRMCVNFVEGEIERIVARKYNAKDNVIQEIPEYIVQKDEDSFPYKCNFPGCKASFKTSKSLHSHVGWHTRTTTLGSIHKPE